jgi:thiol-disulfide isomerase/thioredoxin
MNIYVPKRRLVLVGAVSGLLSLLSGKSRAQSNASRPVNLPGIKLSDLTGATHDLSSFKGKVLMLNFWATWCPPCRAEMPSIEQLHLSMQGKDFVVLGINQGESAEKIKSKMGMFNPAPTFPLLVDVHSEVGAYFKISDLPATLIFNKQGNLTGFADGARDFANASIRKNIEGLLAQ